MSFMAASKQRIFRLANLRASSAYPTSSWPSSRFDSRQCSQVLKSNGTPARLINNSVWVNKLEAQGVPSNQGKAMTSVLIDLLKDRLENASRAQNEHHLALFGRESRKLYSELKHEISKVAAGHKLESDFERRINVELAILDAEFTILKNKLDQEIWSLGPELKAAVDDMGKYCISAVTFATVFCLAAGILMWGL